MLIGMKDRKKMWILGLTFLSTSALIYLLFMVAWLNAATLLLTINWVRLIIGLVALIGGIINLRSYLKHRKDNGCDVIDDNKRNKIFDKIKKFTHEKNFFLAIVGCITLAISVNIIELACSAGLPVMFTQILSMNNLNVIQYTIYIALYMLFFLLDDLIVFFIAMRTMELTGFSTKYGKLAKLIGGILLFIIGILMMFKPEWLMFNF
jgi:cytochrome c biogenesis protein CcdA